MNNSGLLIHAVLDEISLEGLDGLTIPSLWVRLSARLKLPLPLNANFCNQIWKFLLKQNSLLYYELAEARPPIKNFSRCEHLEIENMNAEECPFTTYKFNPICIDKLRGSCQDFDTRTIVDWAFISMMPLKEVIDRFGDKLVIVASQELREAAIFPENVPPPTDLTIFQYCILERVARSRHNGEKTHGKFSMHDLMDSSKSFYIRKALCKHKLIARQPYFDKVPEKSGFGSLLHIPRFYSEYKTKQMTLTEQVVEILKAEPNCIAEYWKVRKNFDESLHMTLRKLYKNNLFQKFVENDVKVLYRTVYPSAPRSEWRMRKRDAERELRVLRLRDPNIDVNDLWPRENIADDIDDMTDILDVGKQLLDVPLIKQAYDYIDKMKGTGASVTEIGRHLGLSKLNARSIMRNLERLNEVCTHFVDQKRQRVQMYVTIRNKQEKKSVYDNIDVPTTAVNSSSSSATATSGDTQKTALTELAGILTDNRSAVSMSESTEWKQMLSEITPSSQQSAEKSSEIKLPDGFRVVDVAVKTELIEKAGPRYVKVNAINASNITPRMAERMKIIMRTVKQTLIISDVQQLVLVVKAEEQKLGHKDTMCRKSIYRLISRLSAEKRIRLWQIVLTHGKCSKTVMFVCDVSIADTNPFFLSLLDREKEKLLVRIASDQSRLSDQEKYRRDEQLRIVEAKRLAEKHKKSAKAPAPKRKRPPLDDEGCLLNYGITPKFIKMRTLHEFMFYLLYAEDKPSGIIKPLPAIERWRTLEPTVDYDDLLSNQMPPIYGAELNWKTFVPPLMPNTEFGDGWILMSDLTLRLPLSLFLKMLNIKVEIVGLNEYLEHPIRKHFLLKYIPPAIQQELVKRRRHLFMIDETMRRLCAIGLVQIGPQWSKDKDQLFVYLNRRTTLLDTSSSEPGYCFIAKKDYPHMEYYFSVTDNVNRYWQQLYQICTSTRLNRRGNFTSDQQLEQLRAWNSQPALIEAMTARLPTDVQLLDNGAVPGDRCGAGGLDSSFFSHLLRNWSLTKYKIRKASSKFSDEDTDDSEPRANEKSVISYKRSVRDSSKKKLVAANKTLKKTARNVIVINRSKGKIQPKSMSRELIRKAARKLRQSSYNEVDKQALRQMTKLRVDWSPEEDNLILFCKVAMLYLCPSPRKQGIPTCCVRDILQWVLKSNDKTSRACQRRIVYMMKKPAIASNVHMCLLEVQHHSEITRAFPKDLYELMRLKFAHEEGFLRAMRIIFVDLVAMLRKYFVTLTKSKLEQSTKHSMIPDTVAEFKRMFEEHSEDYQNECIKYAKPTKRSDIEVDVLSTLIHSSVCCARDKASWSVQLYDIYKNYSDRSLLRAMEMVRHHQMISAKKTVQRSRLKSSESLPLSSSPYHLSVTYQYQLLTSISYEIFHEIYLCMRELYAARPINRIKFSYITPGRCVAFSQLIHNDNIRFDIEIPPKMLVIDKSYCEGDTSERTSSKFHMIFENIPNLVSYNTVNQQAQQSSAATVVVVADGGDPAPKPKKRVMINEEHEKIEYHMSPVEKLMKLDDCMYHFFCLFRKLGTTFEVDAIEIEIPGRYCSFNCVLRETEPILTMIDMIKSDGGLIMRQISIENQEEGIRDTMTIGIDNILIIFSLLVSKIFNSDEPFDLDDVSDYGVLEVSQEVLNDNTDNDSWFSAATKVDNDDGCEQDSFKDGKVTRNILGNYSQENADKIHNYFYVRTCKILFDYAEQKDCSDEEDREKLHRLSTNEKAAVLKRVMSDTHWKRTTAENDCLNTFATEKFTDNEIKLIHKIIKFIEAKEEIGADNSELVKEFDNKSFLVRVIRLLKDLHIIMRAGVSEFTFVHFKYVIPWMISTYNLKRLEKESVGSVPYKLMKIAGNDTDASATTLKRNRDNADDADAEPAANIAKPADSEPMPSTSRASRIEKITIRKGDGDIVTSVVETNPRTMFYLRINPWIRVNGGLNRRVLDKWLGTMLAFCIAHPGSTALKICQRFNLQQPFHIRLLLEYLELLGCIELQTITTRPCTLLSSCDFIVVATATELDPIENVFINVTADAVTKMATFIGDKTYAADFI